jgi:hypothetical protein
MSEEILANAEKIKLQIINYLLYHIVKGEAILASEVRYGTLQRQADMVLIEEDYNGMIIPIEIKSSADQINDKTLAQLQDYLKVFEYVWLVVTGNHLEKAIEIIKDNKLDGVGLMIASIEGGFLKLSPEPLNELSLASQSTTQDLKEILASIPLSFCKKKNEITDIEEAKKIHAEFLKQKLRRRTEALKNHLKTNLDLVRIISTDSPKLEVDRVKDSLSALVGAAESYSKFQKGKNQISKNQ